MGAHPQQHARLGKEWEGDSDEQEVVIAPHATVQGAAAAQPVTRLQRSLHALTWLASLLYTAVLEQSF